MSLAVSVARNTLIQVVGKIIGTILGFTVVVMLTRYLGAAGYGQYTTVMAYLGFFSVIADLGLYLMVVREISKPGADESYVLGNMMGLRIVCAVIVLGAAALISFLMPYPAIVRTAICIGTLSFLMVAVNQLIVGVFQKHLAMSRVVIGELVGRVVLLGATIWLVAAGAGLLTIIWSVVAGSVVNALVTLWFAHRRVRLSVRFDFSYWRAIMAVTWPLSISVVLNLIYFRLDTVFLSIFKGSHDVGLYGAAYKVLEILVTFPTLFVGLVLPILTYHATTNRDRFISVFQKSFDVIVLAALPLVVGGVVLAKPIIVLVGGAEFSGAAVIFQLLLIAVAFLFAGSLSGHTIVAINKQRQMVWGYLTVAIVGIVLYLLLIPRFSYYGAAIGTIITEGTIALIGFIIILRTMQFRLRFGVVFKSLLATVSMAVALWAFMPVHTTIAHALSNADLGLLIATLCSLVLGVVVYLAALLLVRGVSPHFIKEVMQLRAQDQTNIPHA